MRGVAPDPPTMPGYRCAHIHRVQVRTRITDEHVADLCTICDAQLPPWPSSPRGGSSYGLNFGFRNIIVS